LWSQGITVESALKHIATGEFWDLFQAIKIDGEKRFSPLRQGSRYLDKDCHSLKYKPSPSGLVISFSLAPNRLKCLDLFHGRLAFIQMLEGFADVDIIGNIWKQIIVRFDVRHR
jgi:hypothetical protein